MTSILIDVFNFLSKIPGFQKFYSKVKEIRYGKNPSGTFDVLSTGSPQLKDNKQIWADAGLKAQYLSNGILISRGKLPVTSLIIDDHNFDNLTEGQKLPITTSSDDNLLNISLSNNEISLQVMKNQNDGWLKLDISHNFDKIYGLGEKNGELDKSGKTWKMWNSDNPYFDTDSDPLYKSYPVLWLTNQTHWIALILDYPGFQQWDLEKNNKITISLNDDTFNLLLIEANDPNELVKSIIQYLGKMELPPEWALGYHQCRWSYEPSDRVREISNTFRAKEIPLDAIYLDIDYMDDFKCFTYSEDKFGDLPELVNDLHEQNISVVSMIDPGIKVDTDYNIYNDLISNKFITTFNGQPYQGKVWPGKCVFPDFFRKDVRDYWGSLYNEFIKMGIDGFWNDMNEPSIFTLRGTFPDNVIHNIEKQPVEHQFVHNLYGQMMAKASYEGIKEISGKRVFLLSRSGYLGSQQYGWIWTGDNEASWSHLQQSIPKLLNSGLSGHFANGPDIGGFSGTPSPELYARWIQLGIFYPFMRTHTIKGSDNQEPWSFGDEIEQIAKQSIELRYQLLPYIYTWFRYGCKTGIPLIRPMWIEFPNDNTCYVEKWENTQFFFGPDLLIAPIINKKQRKREIYLPFGSWFSFYSKKKYSGNEIIEVQANLDRIPIFVRDDTVIPVYEKTVLSTKEYSQEDIKFEMFGKNPSGFLYLDDGYSYGYKNGDYGLYKINSNGDLSLIEGNGNRI